MRFLFFVFIFASASLAKATDSIWTGYEINGYKSVSREQIAQQIPLKVGDKFSVDTKLWSDVCIKIKNQFHFLYTSCSALKYVDFKVYFVVDVVEQGDDARIKYRPAPQQKLTLADSKILSLYEKLYARLHDLFAQGISSYETHPNGYLTYSDPEMAGCTKQLAQLVPPYHKNLLKVLEFSADRETRAQAANLLNWDLHQPEDVVKSLSLLDDPDDETRNNISRFGMAFVDLVKSSQDREKIIDALIIQLRRPTHGDRNKALYSLLNLLNAFPADAAYLKNHGLKEIQLIESQSILSNVKEPARQILDLLKKP